MAKKLVGAIIAGGRGGRSGLLGFSMPKALLPICDKPIIVHQIEYLKETGIDEIYIVVGYFKEKIIEQIGDGSRWGVKIEYVIQESPQGSGHAVSKLRPYIRGNFVLFLGDIFIKIREFQKYKDAVRRAHEQDKSLLVCKREEDIEKIRQNFTIALDDKDGVVRVVEKPKNPETDLKGCGLYLFTPKIFEAIERTPRGGRRNEYELTHAIQKLIELGGDLYSLEMIEWDFNISSLEELYRCDFMWFKDRREETSKLLSVMIPAYNEEDTIEKVIEKVKELEINKEIIVVDDGSLDRTAEIASCIEGIRLIRHPENMGRGAAIITAIKNSSGAILCTQDADMEQSPSDIPILIQPILEGRASVVYGSRFKEKDCHTKGAWLRIFGNKVFAFLANILFSQRLTDVYTGSKCYNRKIFEKIKLESKGFEQEAEILAKLSRYKLKIYEMPIHYKFRTHGASKIKFKDGIVGIYTMFKYFFKR